MRATHKPSLRRTINDDSRLRLADDLDIGDDGIHEIFRHDGCLAQRVGTLANDENRARRADAQGVDEDASTLEDFDHGEKHVRVM